MFFIYSYLDIHSSSLCQDSPESVRLLSVAVSVFGPRKIVKELFIHNKGDSSSCLSDGSDGQLKEEQFMQMFRDIFVPWCFYGDNCSASARLDLLLALLDDEYFSEQWGSIITYATKLEHSGTMTDYRDSNHIAMLTVLLEKARDKITMRKAGEDCSSRKGANPDHWHHEHLELAAVAVANSLPPFRTSDARFVWYVNQHFQHDFFFFHMYCFESVTNIMAHKEVNAL